MSLYVRRAQLAEKVRAATTADGRARMQKALDDIDREIAAQPMSSVDRQELYAAIGAVDDDNLVDEYEDEGSDVPEEP